MPTSSATPSSPSATVRPSAKDSGTPSTKMPAAIDSPRAAPSLARVGIAIGIPAAAAWPERRIDFICSLRVSQPSALTYTSVPTTRPTPVH
jgi:hypothetical protein